MTDDYATTMQRLTHQLEYLQWEIQDLHATCETLRREREEWRGMYERAIQDLGAALDGWRRRALLAEAELSGPTCR